MLRKISELFAPLSVNNFSEANKVRHFYCTDLLRGISAIVVLFWHYHHFYWTPQTGLDIDKSRQPFYSIFTPFFTDGYWAVQLFWMISGLVFAHVYAHRRAAPKDYFVNRFSRLYPLHFLTLVFIGSVQYVSMGVLGNYQVLSINDWYHFFLNVFFMSHWGFQDGMSYNSPFWSVSVEEGMFILFFFLHRFVFAGGILLPAAFMGMGYAIMNKGTPLWYFGICTFYFFLGVIIYFYLLKFRHWIVFNMALSAGSLALFFHFLPGYRHGGAGSIPFTNLEVFLFFPLIMVSTTLDFHLSGKKIALTWFKKIGDLTYSSYMLHFPLQVVVLTVFQYFGWGRGIFDSRLVFLLWLSGMVVISLLSFRYVEMPLKRYFRRTLPDRLASGVSYVAKG